MARKDDIERKRKEDRVAVSLHVDLANTESVTRDVSASGVFIETNSTFTAGENLDFAIEFDSPGGKLFLKCNGVIVRVEDRNGKLGVGVKIIDSVMESAEGKIYMEAGINVLSSSCIAGNEKREIERRATERRSSSNFVKIMRDDVTGKKTH